MIDFGPVRRNEKTHRQMAEGLTREDLVRLTSAMCDMFQDLIADARDAHVTFVPDDPDADDRFAARPEDARLAWTLGHVIVHWTASSEEAAALALSLARGVAVTGRSRSELPWREATTVAFIRERIEDSRRMQLSMLDAWPARPHLDNTHKLWDGGAPMNAVERFVTGLSHADAHRDHVRKIIAEARAAPRG